jgi:hypothetical protein
MTKSFVYHLAHRSLFSTTAIIVASTALFALSGCNNVSRSSTVDTPAKPAMSIIQAASTLNPAVQKVVGDYATSDYDKRAQGYDWVGVMIRPAGAAEIDIKIRARDDIKKPSCSFDGKAVLMGQDDAHGIIFQTIANNSVTFLQFKDAKLTIDAQDKYALNYFCSGGATLAGDYQKLTGKLTFD